MKNKEYSEKNSVREYQLDAKDKEILHLLQRNAKSTVQDIARQIHLSTSPTHDRIKRLEDAGYIMQYAALLDKSKIGKKLTVICYVSLKEHNKKAGTKFIENIIAMPEVSECYSISGEYDFMLKVHSADMETYYDFHVNKLSQADNVGHIQSTFVMGTIKEELVGI